jgi:hypothetical protein
LLGGGANGYSITDIAPITLSLSLAFNSGVATSFAQAHLVNGPCP